MDNRVQSLPKPKLPLVATTAKLKVATKSGVLHGAWEDGIRLGAGGNRLGRE